MYGFENVESEKGSSLLRPGIVKVELAKVELTDAGDLDITFKGIEEGNEGSFKPRWWVNSQNTNDAKYNETRAKRSMAHLKHVLEGFLTSEEVKDVKGNTVQELYRACAASLTPHIGKQATMKVVYKFGSDSLCELPFYGVFLSTEIKKNTLSINTKVGKDGLPYDRVKPLADYGVSGTNDEPEDATPFKF